MNNFSEKTKSFFKNIFVRVDDKPPMLLTAVKSKGFSSFSSSLIAICMGLLVGFFIMLFVSPSEAGEGILKVLSGGLSGGSKGVGDTFYFATPILCTGLAVGFAFKTGLFNIGATGQYTMGMYLSMLVAFSMAKSGATEGVWFLCVLAGIAGGALWGAIPGFFKAYLNVNEVITSIMFNYIGMYYVDMKIKGNTLIFDQVQQRTRLMPDVSSVPKFGLDKIFPNSNINGGIIIAIIFAVILWIILNKTTFGYELKACGYNKHASGYAGINAKRNIVLSMIIAGGMAGLGGALMICAGADNIYEPINVLAANGFNGIPVALLGMSNPIGIVVAAIFVSHLMRGGYYIQLLSFSPDVVDVIIGVVIYFSAFALIIKEVIVRIIKNNNNKKLSKGVASKAPAAYQNENEKTGEGILPNNPPTSGSKKLKTEKEESK